LKNGSEIVLDSRKAAEIVAQVLARRPGYVPSWIPADKGPDIAVTQVFARYLYAILQRLNQVPDKNKLAFLDLLGIQLIAPAAARVPIVFQLAEQAPDTRINAGLQVAAPPPPESEDQVVFEIERATGLSATRLQQVFSLWPGRDQYIDHSVAVLASQPFEIFKRSDLRDTPHILYLAHDTLLALSGKSQIDVEFELTTVSSETLDVSWDYWDGKVWRGFKAMEPECGQKEALKLDTTVRLTRSGKFELMTDCAKTAQTEVNAVNAFWIRGRLTEPLPPDPSNTLPEVEKITLSAIIENLPAPLTEEPSATALGGVVPDKAFTDGAEIDLTKPFYPFGQSPQPGITFYFSTEEIFSKPGAKMYVFIVPTATPQDQFAITSTEPPIEGPAIVVAPTAIDHELSWEYWNGRGWFPLNNWFLLDGSPADGPSDFTGLRTYFLELPLDFERTKVNDQEGFWMRARLVSGGYGFTKVVKWDDAGGSHNEFTYFIPQPPAVSDFRLGYTWQHGPFNPEHVFTYNDFQFEDHTEDAKWPGVTFQIFKPTSDVTPSLYLGCDKKLPVDRVSLYFDIVEQPGEIKGPALLWEYWDGVAWRNLSVEDETNNLRVPGLVSFIGPADSQALTRFGQSLFWLRIRLKEDGPPGTATFNSILTNAVWATQRQTIVNEQLGESGGQPNEVFNFIQIPVLEGERIEVRELVGLRANTEWRNLAMEVLGNNVALVQQLEEELSREGQQNEVEKDDLRLVRDRRKRVVEAWVCWTEQKHLSFAAANERVYAVDRIQGRLRFGDGEHGKVPPEGAMIMARRYQSGGGLRGNVGVKTITQLLAPAAGVQGVFNPRSAEGGGDAETVEALLTRGPKTLRHRGRALLPEDYETLARESSTAVGFARAIPTHNSYGRKVPGWVTLLIIPESDEPRPWPSFGLREHVRKFIEARAPADLAAAAQIYVTGPQYLEIDIDVTLAPISLDVAGEVEDASREALEKFFHPLHGGPDGHGWPLGRDVFLSDVASVLERVKGVDYVKELALLREGTLEGERIAVPDDRIVVAGDIKIKLIIE
jgi:hypothetical protein